MYFPPTFLVYFETNLITVFFLPFSSLQMLPIPLSTLLIIHISFHQYLINILIFNQMLICAYMYLHIHTHICSMYVCIFLTVTCWIHQLLLLCMFSRLFGSRQPVGLLLPGKDHFYSQLLSAACSSLCWVEAPWAFPCLF